MGDLWERRWRSGLPVAHQRAQACCGCCVKRSETRSACFRCPPFITYPLQYWSSHTDSSRLHCMLLSFTKGDRTKRLVQSVQCHSDHRQSSRYLTHSWAKPPQAVDRRRRDNQAAVSSVPKRSSWWSLPSSYPIFRPARRQTTFDWFADGIEQDKLSVDAVSKFSDVFVCFLVFVFAILS